MAHAPVVITPMDGVASASAIDGVFQGLSFFVLQRVSKRSHLIETIQANGGRVVKLETQATHVVADHLQPAVAPAGSVLYTFIEAAVKDGQLPDPADHLAGPRVATVRPVNGVTPAKSTRTSFTREDDMLLREWVREAQSRGGLVKGNELYKQLEEHNPRHTFQAWRNRYIKKLMLLENPSATPQVEQPVEQQAERPASRPGRRSPEEPVQRPVSRLGKRSREEPIHPPRSSRRARFTEEDDKKQIERGENAAANGAHLNDRFRREEHVDVVALPGEIVSPHTLAEHVNTKSISSPQEPDGIKEQTEGVDAHNFSSPREHSDAVEQIERAEEELPDPHDADSERRHSRDTSPSSTSSGSADGPESPGANMNHGYVASTQDIVDAETQFLDLNIPPPPEDDSEEESDGDLPPSAIPSRPISIESSRAPPPEHDHVESQKLPEDGLDDYIDALMQRGHAEEAIIDALKCTSMRPKLAELVLSEIKAGKALPDGVPGIWSEPEDQALEGGDANAIRLLEKKHSWDELEIRFEFLREWRE